MQSFYKRARIFDPTPATAQISSPALSRFSSAHHSVATEKVLNHIENFNAISYGVLARFHEYQFYFVKVSYESFRQGNLVGLSGKAENFLVVPLI